MSDSKIAFVAYPSADKQLASDILDAVRRANATSSLIRYEPWEFNDIAGRPLISPILERIGESEFVVADITYLNLNVVYEIGFTDLPRDFRTIQNWRTAPGLVAS